MEKVDIAIGRKVRIKGEPEKSTVFALIDLRPDVNKRRRKKEPIFENAHHATLLQDKDAAIRSESEPYRGEGWQRGNDFRKKVWISEDGLCLYRSCYETEDFKQNKQY
jgi:hypothetical protein